MKRQAPDWDPRRRTVIVNGKRHVLHEKTWQVLRFLVDHAPDIVSRADVVDQLWSGRSMTGEKGLNQAIWNLRSVLGDDPRNPVFIRTVPRVGYRWIGPLPGRPERPRWQLPAGIAAAVSLLVAAAAVDSGRVATNAYRIGLDVYVEFDDGVVGVLRNASEAEIGTPVLSNDGRDIVVPVYEDRACRLVVVNLTTRQRQDFAGCPAS